MLLLAVSGTAFSNHEGIMTMKPALIGILSLALSLSANATNSSRNAKKAATGTLPHPVATCSGKAVTTAGVIAGTGQTFCVTAPISGTIELEGTGTLDLNGNTITYSSGAAILGCNNGGKIYPAFRTICASSASIKLGRWHITNSAGNTVGGIVQAENAPVGIPAIFFGSENEYGGAPPTPNIDNLHIVLHNTAAQGIRCSYTSGGATIKNNVIDATALTSIQLPGEIPYQARARFGGYMIWIANEGGVTTRPDTITGNTILGAPQGGIVDQMTGSTISYNRATMNSHYSNDYIVLSTANNQIIENNSGSGQGRAYDLEGNGWTLRNNTANVYETNLNTEYHGCEEGGGYGVRVRFQPQDNKGAPGGTMEGNDITASAKLCQAIALELTGLSSSSSIKLSDNKFTTVAGPGGVDAAVSGENSAAVLTGTGNVLTGSIGFFTQYAGADMTIPAGQIWNLTREAVYEDDGGSDSGADFPLSLTILDKPTNAKVLCAAGATGTVIVGEVTTTCKISKIFRWMQPPAALLSPFFKTVAK
jgi:hypothetical protein